jgi:glycosyltransferase involved in cell wall biosynthesis
MACGLTVIATNVGGLADVLDAEETAIVVPVGDAEALEAAIERVLGDSPYLSAIATRARARAEEKFAEKMIVAQYLELLQQMVAERRQTRANG